MELSRMGGVFMEIISRKKTLSTSNYKLNIEQAIATVWGDTCVKHIKELEILT